MDAELQSASEVSHLAEMQAGVTLFEGCVIAKFWRVVLSKLMAHSGPFGAGLKAIASDLGWGAIFYGKERRASGPLRRLREMLQSADPPNRSQALASSFRFSERHTRFSARLFGPLWDRCSTDQKN